MGMRVKEIKVIVRPLEEDFDEIAEAFKKIEKGEAVKDEKIVVESLDTLRKFLTPERLKILQVIKEHRPKSIYELSKIIKKDRRNLTRDLELLESIGLIEFEKSDDKKVKKMPVVSYDEIQVSIPV